MEEFHDPLLAQVKYIFLELNQANNRMLKEEEHEQSVELRREQVVSISLNP